MPNRPPYAVEGIYAAVTCVTCMGRGDVRRKVGDKNGELLTCNTCNGKMVTMKMITLADLRQLLGLPE